MLPGYCVDCRQRLEARNPRPYEANAPGRYSRRPPVGRGRGTGSGDADDSRSQLVAVAFLFPQPRSRAFSRELWLARLAPGKRATQLASVRPQTLSSWATCGIGAFAQAG